MASVERSALRQLATRSAAHSSNRRRLKSTKNLVLVKIMQHITRCAVHLRLGYASFAEYIERLFGYRPRWTEARVRVAEALEHLPLLAQALRDGAISWSVVRELTRVASPENESDWLRAATGRTCRDVEELVAGLKLGDGPGDTGDPAAQRHVLHMEHLLIEGRVSTGLRFRHADGRGYGAEVDAAAASAYAEAFRGLRGLGFREGEAQRALARVRERAHVGGSGVPDLIRAALGVLASSRGQLAVRESCQLTWS